jgi:ABC-type dipeptide/oligopeptide/nickel transport system permease component
MGHGMKNALIRVTTGLTWRDGGGTIHTETVFSWLVWL